MGKGNIVLYVLDRTKCCCDQANLTNLGIALSDCPSQPLVISSIVIIV